EFSWKVESLLNRVLDGSRAPSPAVVAVVDHAFYALPMLQAALKGEHGGGVDLAALEADAERIAAGDEAMPEAPLRTSPAGETGPVPDAAGEADAPPVARERDDPTPDRLPAQVDELLLEILDAEVGGHLTVVDGWLERAATVGVSSA